MRILITIYLLLGCTLLNAQSPSDFEKASKLYSQVVSGERKFESLTQNEQQQVLSIQQLFTNSCGNLHGKCKDVCEAADELKNAADNLSRCAKRHDYSNDCGSKFRETKYKFEEYENAVSDASSDCS